MNHIPQSGHSEGSSLVTSGGDRQVKQDHSVDMNKIKSVAGVLLLLGLTSCNYPSQDQAFEACSNWASKGESIGVTKTYGGAVGEYVTALDRKCELERVTNQYLGKQGKFDDVDRGKGKRGFSYSGNCPEASHYKIVKHFRF